MRADRPSRILRRVPFLTHALGVILLSALVLCCAPGPGGQARADVPQSMFGTLTAELNDALNAYDFMALMLVKTKDPKLAVVIRHQMQAQIRDIKTLVRMIHEDCERINHPKDFNDTAERTSVLLDFRNKNMLRMVGDAVKAFGMSPGKSAAQVPGSEAKGAVADATAEVIDHLSGSHGAGIAGTGLAVFNGISDVVNYWKMTKPFVAAAARAQDFKSSLRKCPLPPNLKGLEITPSEEVHPFGPKVSKKP